MRRILRIALPLSVLFLWIAPAQALPGPGEPAPAFTLGELGRPEKRVDSAALFAGRTTLLSFFATWCKPCKAEIPEFQRMVAHYGGKGFQAALVSLDQLGADDVRVFLREAGAGDLPVLWDEEGDMMALYGFFGLPTNVVIGPDGIVVMSWMGDLPAKLRELDAYLEGLPAAPR
ncbi:MAG: TlpA family protein disulfide reductase [Proteobacteria bacterium]|nr:TlpA family protein disulfide reductase [Pseudomonadota bacterium]